MKKTFIVSAILILVMCGCSHRLPLSQSAEQISRIELINEAESTILCTITGAEISTFINEMMVLDCHKNLHPIDRIGYLQVHIYYEDGDMDFIGCSANGSITDGVRCISGWYYYDEADMLNLFRSYMSENHDN